MTGIDTAGVWRVGGCENDRISCNQNLFETPCHIIPSQSNINVVIYKDLGIFTLHLSRNWNLKRDRRLFLGIGYGFRCLA